MQVLKDLKRCFSRERSRGTGPRATGPEGVLLSMRPFGIRRARTTVSCPYNLANLENLVNPEQDYHDYHDLSGLGL